MRPMGGGGSTVPPGDPGAVRAAAGQLSGLAGQISGARSQSQGVAVQLAGRTWSSQAAGVFRQAAGTYDRDLGTLESALMTAAGALRSYAAALEAAQQQARHAIAAQSQANADAVDAQNRLAAASPPGASPSEVQAFNAQQQQASTAVQDTLTRALNAAGTSLGGAFTQAHAAAVACAAALEGSAAKMAPLARLAPHGRGAHGVTNQGDWEKDFEGWFGNAGHVNDFLGAGAVSLVKQYERSVENLGQAATKIFDKLPQDEAGIDAILAGQETPAGLDELGNKFDAAVGLLKGSDNSLVNLLTRGLSSDEGSLLEKVPVLGALFTLGAIGFNVGDHEPLPQAVGEPVVNLAVGTATAEVVSTLLAGTAVPVVGEVIICGVVAAAVGYGVDKGATWLWDHRAQIGHDVETAVNTLLNADGTVLHYGDVAWKATTEALNDATGWAASETKKGLAAASNFLATVGTTAGNAVVTAGETAVHYADPLNWF